MAARTAGGGEGEAWRDGGRHRNVVLVLQHPHVFTLGRGASVEHLHFPVDAVGGGVQSGAVGGGSRGWVTPAAPAAGAPPPAPVAVDVHRVERGGKVTYHGPGQLVVYPLLNLRHFTRDLHWYVHAIERVLIETAAAYGVAADRAAGRPGVWVRGGTRKVAAVGMSCSKWYTMHGFALNVAPDLSFFDAIVPCGIEGAGVASLRGEVAAAGGDAGAVTVDAVKPVLLRAFQDVFDCDVVAADGDPVEGDVGGAAGGAPLG